MSEAADQYLTYICGRTHRSFIRCALFTIGMSVISALMMLYIKIGFVPFLFTVLVPACCILLFKVLYTVRSENLQTVACLFGDMKEVFVGITDNMLKRGVMSAALGVTLLILSHCLINGVDISILDVLYSVLCVSSAVVIDALMVLLCARVGYKNVYFLFPAFFGAWYATTLLMNVGYLYSVVSAAALFLLMTCVVFYLLRNWVVNKEKLVFG